MNLLVVHDNENMRGALTRMAGNLQDYQVVSSSSDAALSIARRLEPELVLLDVTVESLERALHVLRGIKRELSSNVVVIAMLPPALPGDAMRQITDASSLVRWLRRPFAQADLQKALHDASIITKFCRKLSHAHRSSEDLMGNPLRAVTG